MKRSDLLSDAAGRIEGQPMFKVLDKVQSLEKKGVDIIHFEIGDPDFDTPRHIIDAAYSSMLKGETHYTSSMGLFDLRDAAACATLRSRGFKPSLDQVLITPGANIIIYLVVACVVNPGDEVIFPDPGFPTYQSVIKFCKVKGVPVPLRESNKFRLDHKDVKKAITKKTRLIIINSPSNPTGSIMTKEEIDGIYRLAEKNGIYLLSDEIYSRMRYSDIKFYSPSYNDKCRTNTIVLNGFSKAFAMTGWRLGVAIGPTHLIERMGLL
ncbi:MAG TPA: aminotransferase class I/II-fold pyridoxal phosphate-dependent enzyme, partial [Candidatus Omnitrophota bacterium]|nr:aminotransferase class I/II-fold pyridoxal phosphate-dependent enzyme [Candidatus Omnitrophota bacterium]